MGRFGFFRSHLITLGVRLIALAMAILLASGAMLLAADTNSTNAPVAAPKKESKTEPAKVSGAKLYAINCNRCHPERLPTEFNPAQWKTLMLHMRVRANLPAKQAREILKYLQEGSGQ